MTDLIPLKEACRLLTVSRRTLDRLIAQHQITVVQVSPRRYAIPLSEIKRHISSNTIPANPAPMRSKPRCEITLSGDDEAMERLRARLIKKR